MRSARSAMRHGAKQARLRVRMGIHTGPEEWLGSDYAVSHTLNRVARIMSAGHGGEILVSSETVESVNGILPDRATVRDLGKHRLKGLKIPEHIFQLVVPDLPSNFPPLNVLDSYNAHFDTVVRSLSENRVVPFLGASVNLVGRPSDKPWQFGQSDFLPVGVELADHLARTFDYPSSEPRDLVRGVTVCRRKSGHRSAVRRTPQSVQVGISADAPAPVFRHAAAPAARARVSPRVDDCHDEF